MGSPPPFPANFYNHLPGGMALPQRVLANQAFSSNNLSHNFHLSFQQTSRPQPISPNRGILAASNSQGLKQRTNNLIGGSNFSALSSFTRFNDIGGSGGGGPSLDYAQFPSLSVRPSCHNQVIPARNYAIHAPYTTAVSMVSKQDTSSEFQIQQEDFPALPGAQNPSTSSLLDNSIKQSSYEVKEGGKTFADKTVGQRRGIQTHPDGTLTNVPSSMVGDQFGMVGLLTFIRASETDPNLVALAPGFDLTTLGLNLNQSEALFTGFQSPWSDLPCRPQDIDYHVPNEYHTNMYVRDKLAPLRLSRYNEDLLFFLFYLYGGDLLQLAAAAELYNRDWRYHKEERLWMTRAPGMEPTQKSREHERGTYFFFDPAAWRKVAKEFHLDYSKLEERPQLPDSLFTAANNNNNNQSSNNNNLITNPTPGNNNNTGSVLSINNNNNPTTTNNNNHLNNNFLNNNSNSNNFINNYNNNFNNLSNPNVANNGNGNNNTFFNIGNNNNNPPNTANNLSNSRPAI